MQKIKEIESITKEKEPVVPELDLAELEVPAEAEEAKPV